MNGNSNSKSWWQTLPGILIVIAGTVLAITGLGSNPVFQKGTILKTVRGAALTLESQLHAGSNATLFLASTHSGGKVVVKIFSLTSSFDNEQQAAKRLKHRNIISILDTGVVGTYPFTVMDYYRGGSLEEWLKNHNRITGPDILSVATQVADAIDFAHSHGFTHGDIKASNILIESESRGRVVLSDFGVARAFDASQTQNMLTHNELLGTPEYLAPEAVKSKQITQASDIYSFGVVLFEMIAGKNPFANAPSIEMGGPTTIELAPGGRAVVSELLYKKANENAPDIRDFSTDVPEVVAVRIAQTLSRDPNDRPRSARAVLLGIEDAIRGL